MSDHMPMPEDGTGTAQPPTETAAPPPPPPSPEAARPRPWWKKKRYMIPVGALVLFSAAAALGDGDGSGTVPTAASSSPSTSVSSSASTPSASEEPAAAATSETPTPEVKSYAGDYAGAFGTFSALAKSGRGDAVVKLPAGVQGAILVATYKGSSNFAIHSLDSGNQSIDLLVNEIGRYSGTTMIEAEGDDVAKLKIEASGAWSIAVKPVAQAPVWKSSNTGKGDGVFLYEQGAADWAVVHSGKSNFAVKAEGNGDGLLINEIGAYKGVVPVSEGPAVIVVTADGSWTATKQ